MASQSVEVNKIRAMWPHISDEGCIRENYTCFWRCIMDRIGPLNGDAHDLHPLTSDDIFWIIGEARRQKESTRQAILDVAKQQFAKKEPSEAAISRSVNLAVGLWLSLKVQSRPLEPPSGLLQWNDNQSLVDVLRTSFEAIADPGTDKKGSVNDELTIEKLVRDYGFTVVWTSNLVEHLTLKKETKIVKVYEHKIFLRNHQLARDQTALPQSVVGECIDTLNLLFPLGESRTTSFLSKQRKTFNKLGNCNRERCSKLDNYKIWRENLEELSMVLDEEPVGARQFVLWRSGKNSLQLATFWIAAIVAILTIISFVTGVTSTMYAKKAYDIAVIQYQFSVAEACSDPEVAARLDDWCSNS